MFPRRCVSLQTFLNGGELAASKGEENLQNHLLFYILYKKGKTVKLLYILFSHFQQNVMRS